MDSSKNASDKVTRNNPVNIETAKWLKPENHTSMWWRWKLSASNGFLPIEIRYEYIDNISNIGIKNITKGISGRRLSDAIRLLSDVE